MIDPITSIGAGLAGGRPRRKHLGLLLCVLFVLSACSPTSRVVLDSNSPELRHERTVVVGHTSPQIESLLRAEVSKWNGTPHELGGTTARGIDCSAFVQRVYANTFELQLPRTTNDQVRSGTTVRRRDLQPGDLVFFKPPTKTRHVGIYLDDGEFAHASTSQGVTISDINQEYWVNSYWTSRRVLAPTDQPVAFDRTRVVGVEPSPAPPAERAGETSKPARIGW